MSKKKRSTRQSPQSTKPKNPRHTRPAQAKRSARRIENHEASERLQKVLATAGLGSRRSLEKRIEAGDIRVNGEPARLGATVSDGDRVLFEGRRLEVIATETPAETLIYYKPEGEVTTRSDPEGRRTVFDRLPRPEQGRWITIGRLDLNTSGLLLLTTDGELANRMMHPSGQVDREYLCRIRGDLSNDQLQALLNGVKLEDGSARFSDLVVGETTSGHTWYTVTIMEGRNREVRRLWDAVGAQVARLKRVRFGPVFLPKGVRTGQYERLTGKDHRILREDVGLQPRDVTLTVVES